MRRARWVAGAAVLAMACNGDQTKSAGIMIALATDMTVPESIDEVGLYIEHVQGTQRTVVVSQEQKPLFNPRTGTYELRFTATFAVVASADPKGDSIRSRFVGFAKDGTVVAMREGRVSMPDKDVRQLKLPLLFVNEGKVEDTMAGTVAPAGTGAGLQQLQEGSRTDPFTRWRHPGCREDETLGDDGECTPIDIDVRTLPVLDELPPPAACVDTLGCFGGGGEGEGGESRGVRELALNADCTVSTAGLDADKLALALRTRTGYTDLHAQFIPQNLYSFDAAASVLTLKKPLCERAQKAGVTRVLVSIRCAPMAPEAPICALWQDAPKPVAPDATASFPSDPPLPDGEAPDTGDGPADSSGDGDASEPPLVAYQRFISLPVGTQVEELTTFVARPGGKTWMVLRGNDKFGGTAPDGQGDVDAAQFTFASDDPGGMLWLGADSTAYLQQQYQQPSVLADDSTTFTALATGNGCGLANGIGPQYFSMGNVGSRTVALYGGSGGAPPAASVVDGACFHDSATINDVYVSTLYRGTEYDGKFRIPAVDTNSYLVFDPAADGGGGSAIPFTPIDAGPGFNLTVTSLVDVGGGHTALEGKFFSGQGYDTSLYQGLVVGGEPTAGERLATEELSLPTREIFGGGDTLCARLHDSVDDFKVLTCVHGVTQAVHTVDRWSGSHNVDDVHVYGDTKYLYLAKACYDTGTRQATKVLLTATPWADVTGNVANVLRDDVACSDQPPPPVD